MYEFKEEAGGIGGTMRQKPQVREETEAREMAQAREEVETGEETEVREEAQTRERLRMLYTFIGVKECLGGKEWK